LTDFWGNTVLINNRIDDPLGLGKDWQNKEVDTYEAGCDLLRGNYYILCRTNKQVKALLDLGYKNVSTVHQAKGLEYDNVITMDFNIKDQEDLNIAYVAATRARNKLMIINFDQLYRLLVLFKNNNSI
jgi:superfamily I DNA/RNA helicase